MEKGEDSLRTSHLDDFRSKSAISETTDVFRTMWDMFKFSLGQIICITLDTEVQLLRQLISLNDNAAKLTILQGQISKMTRGRSAIVETTDLLKDNGERLTIF